MLDYLGNVYGSATEQDCALDHAADPDAILPGEVDAGTESADTCPHGKPLGECCWLVEDDDPWEQAADERGGIVGHRFEGEYSDPVEGG